MFTLHKTAFQDALALITANTPTSCACGVAFSVEHALSCITHNEIRDYTAYVLSKICHNVLFEPHLQPITGEFHTSASANFQDGTRLDVAADGFWGSRLEKAFFDVKVFYPYAPSIDDLNYLPATVPTRPQRNEPMSKGSSMLNMPPSPHSSSLPSVA